MRFLLVEQGRKDDTFRLENLRDKPLFIPGPDPASDGQ